ncbi:MAG: Lrp/AsnC family transcriptional regulator [Sporichthyaceae bacterium]
MTALDPLDERIIAALRADARTSYADIGALVSLSAPAVKRRVDRLRATGAIRGFTTVVDPAALGWSTEAFVELYCAGKTSPAQIQAAVARFPEVVAACTVTGDADALLHVLAQDIKHLEQVVEQIAAERFVTRTRSAIVMSSLVRRTAPPGTAADRAAASPPE